MTIEWNEMGGMVCYVNCGFLLLILGREKGKESDDGRQVL
jgi:hypothetical protein